jgi:hypothetical protein
MTPRDLARWLFHSPGRLLAAVVVLVVASGLTLWAAQAGTSAPYPAPPAVAAPSDPTAPSLPADATDPSTSRRAAVDGDGHGTHRAPARAPVRRTAARYLRVFLSTTGARVVWQARLDRFSTRTLARLNATVPRTRVPDATLRRLTLTALGSSYASLRAVLSDGTWLTIALVLDTDGWKVTEVAPERAR